MPYANGALSNFIHQNAEVISQEFIDEGTKFVVRVDNETKMKIRAC